MLAAQPVVVGDRPVASMPVMSNQVAATPDAAKLALANASNDPSADYLSDGITEDITTELSKIKRLRTFSRAVVLPYRDKPVTAGQIEEALGTIVGPARATRLDGPACDRIAGIARRLAPVVVPSRMDDHGGAIGPRGLQHRGDLDGAGAGLTDPDPAYP